MEYTGVHAWLLGLLKYLDRDRFQIDILVQDITHPGIAERFEALGAKIHCVPGWNGNALATPVHLFRFAKFIAKNGPYKTVHCHDGLDAAPILAASKHLGIPIRIAHSHSAHIGTWDWFSPSKTGIRWVKRKMIDRYAALGFASRPHSASALFGRGWLRDSRWRTFFCGLDEALFERVPDRTTIRRSIGIPEDAMVVGHVGRFLGTKNHEKVVDVFNALHAKRPGVFLLLIGDGGLRASIEHKVRRYGLSDRVIFTGLRDDVPRLMQDVMDVFLFPSFYEGLGTAFLEAQAAGLPCVISDDIPRFVDVTKEQIVRLDISVTDALWADAIWNASKRGRRPFNRRLFSRFDLERSIPTWERIYSTGKVF